MSANVTGAARKLSNKAKPTPGRNSAKQPDFDEIRFRLFEPQRESREFLIDVTLMEKIGDYELFLTDRFGQKPASNKVIELLLEESLRSNTEFETWRRSTPQKRSATAGSDEAEDDEILGNLGAPGKAKTA